jgi:hypothetical protein
LVGKVGVSRQFGGAFFHVQQCVRDGSPTTASPGYVESDAEERELRLPLCNNVCRVYILNFFQKPYTNRPTTKQDQHLEADLTVRIVSNTTLTVGCTWYSVDSADLAT